MMFGGKSKEGNRGKGMGDMFGQNTLHTCVKF